MNNPNIPYQSFCWVVGTTSFRTAQLNLKIEQQLHLLNQLQQNQSDWKWDKAQQIAYYELMHASGFLKGNAKISDKDAREKTSGLVDIGLIGKDRALTSAGLALLKISQNQQFMPQNPLNLDEDSFIYFKQLLKVALNIDVTHKVRPYLILAYFLTKFDYLTIKEFKYLLPLCISVEQIDFVGNTIQEYRKNNSQLSIEDIIFKCLIRLRSYETAREVFLNHTQINENVICLIGMNRKSRDYDKPYFPLYEKIVHIFLHNQDDVLNLYEVARAVKQDTNWINLLFATKNKKLIQSQGKQALNPNNPFSDCLNEMEIREQFFKYLHIFKAMATLEDYHDLNKRYFALTDTLIFEDNRIRFDTLPKYFFQDAFERGLGQEMFQYFEDIGENLALSEISPSLKFDEQRISQKMAAVFGQNIQSVQQINQFIEDERYQRFHDLLNTKFSKNNLINLLDNFKNRHDKEIAQHVTDDADIPTIFEYVLGIIWYEISERQGDILRYMKLSLDANLLPKSHAAGGDADLVYEYSGCLNYPTHTLLLEATLATSSNQRRMEMEPVSRHLGEQRLKSGCEHDYCVFVSTYLHDNVVADFRIRRLPEYYYYSNNGNCIQGMKIIPLSTDNLKDILQKSISYNQLYKILNTHYQTHAEPKLWMQQLNKLLRA